MRVVDQAVGPGTIPRCPSSRTGLVLDVGPGMEASFCRTSQRWTHRQQRIRIRCAEQCLRGSWDPLWGFPTSGCPTTLKCRRTFALSIRTVPLTQGHLGTHPVEAPPTGALSPLLSSLEGRNAAPHSTAPRLSCVSTSDKSDNYGSETRSTSVNHPLWESCHVRDALEMVTYAHRSGISPHRQVAGEGGKTYQGRHVARVVHTGKETRNEKNQAMWSGRWGQQGTKRKQARRGSHASPRPACGTRHDPNEDARPQMSSAQKQFIWYNYCVQPTSPPYRATVGPIPPGSREPHSEHLERGWTAQSQRLPLPNRKKEDRRPARLPPSPWIRVSAAAEAAHDMLAIQRRKVRVLARFGLVCWVCSRLPAKVTRVKKQGVTRVRYVEFRPCSPLRSPQFPDAISVRAIKTVIPRSPPERLARQRRSSPSEEQEKEKS